MLTPLILIVMSTQVWGQTYPPDRVRYCKGHPDNFRAVEGRRLWAQTPYGARKRPVLEAFQPNPAVFRPLGIGEPCSQEAVDKNLGIDPACLMNSTFFLP